MSVALALGQVEEAMGALDDNDRQGCCDALVRARNFLRLAAVVADARVPVAHYTPLRREEILLEGGGEK
jgi:hypothetical protein